MSDRSIANAVSVGHLHLIFRGVFGVGHVPVGHRAHMLAATLACGKGAVVSHRSAAALLGLLDRPPTVIEVIALSQAGRHIDGIRPHFVPPPQDDETGRCDSIPCTSPSRTLVDLTGMLSEGSMRRLVERAAVLQVLDVDAIERGLARARRRGAPTLRRILANWKATRRDPGAVEPAPGQFKLRSDLEARLLALIGAATLHAPLCNQGLTVDGRRIEVDFLWPQQQLVVETDGWRFHDNPLAFERDRLRDRALHLAGYRVVRFTHEQIGKEPDAVVAAIRRLLARG